MQNRRVWIQGILAAAGSGFAAHQIWRHGHAYVFANQFAAIEPGKIYRGAWQKPWPMRRIVQNYHIKTILALAHPPEHPLAVGEKALAEELGVRWIHIPIVDRRNDANSKSVSDLLEEAAAVVADPKNQPIFLHCHHGLNRASMVQIAYRIRYCDWPLERAFDEIQRTFGLVTVDHGPDYHHMEEFYAKRVATRKKPGETAASSTDPGQPVSAHSSPSSPQSANRDPANSAVRR